MKGIERLSVIRHKSKINNDWNYTDLFKILKKEDIWIIAYKALINNKNYLSKEIKKEKINDVTRLRLKRLRQNVILKNYYFKVPQKHKNNGAPLPNNVFCTISRL